MQIKFPSISTVPFIKSTDSATDASKGLFMKDFFVSYTEADKSWAEWIAWQLEHEGYTTVIQAWDFHAGSNFVSNMQKAAIETEYTIAVISPTFFTSPYTEAEWTSAFSKDPTGAKPAIPASC